MLRVCQRTRGIHGNEDGSRSRGYEGGDRWEAEGLALEDRNLKGNRVLCDY